MKQIVVVIVIVLALVVPMNVTEAQYPDRPPTIQFWALAPNAQQVWVPSWYVWIPAGGTVILEYVVYNANAFYLTISGPGVPAEIPMTGQNYGVNIPIRYYTPQLNYPGTYVMKLKVIDQNGWPYTSQQQVTVCVGHPGC